MSVFNHFRAKKHEQKFRSVVVSNIKKAQLSSYPSTEGLLNTVMNDTINAQTDLFKKWEKDVEYESIALFTLFNTGLDLIRSGYFHIEKSLLSPHGEHLYFNCKSWLSIAFRKGYISREELRDYYSQLDIYVKLTSPKV